ncbi:MAG: HAMP domain-containing sensor histidine kinase [Acidobacteriota bacterium]
MMRAHDASSREGNERRSTAAQPAQPSQPARRPAGSLRVRLFVTVGGLVALLVIGQWFWMRSLTRTLSSEMQQVAVSVGDAVAQVVETQVVEAHVVDARGLLPDRLIADAAATATDDAAAAGASDASPATRLRSRAIARMHATGDGASSQMTWQLDDDAEIIAVTTDDDGTPHVVHRRGALTDAARDVEIDAAARRDDGDADAARGPRYRYTMRSEFAARDGDGDGATTRARTIVLQLDDQAPGDLKIFAPGLPQAARVSIPQDGVDRALADFQRSLLIGLATILLIGLGLAAVVAERVSAPLRRLGDAADRLGAGALGLQMDAPGDAPREVRATFDAFNAMSRRLATLDAAARAADARQHLGEIGEVARGVVHALRNPLHALGLSVAALTAGGDDDPARDDERAALAQAAQRQIGRIDSTLRAFLTLASDGGTIDDAVDVGSLAEDVALEALQGQPPGAHRIAVRVERDASASDDPTLRAVAPELRAVLQALVINAVEAARERSASASDTDDAGDARVVRIGLARDGARLRVTVRDRGPGLPPSVRARLFTPHVSTKATGSGMGLFLAHRIATTRYDGQLRLDDRDGGGTRATLELGPRGVDRPAATAADAAATAEAA